MIVSSDDQRKILVKTEVLAGLIIFALVSLDKMNVSNKILFGVVLRLN